MCVLAIIVAYTRKTNSLKIVINHVVIKLSTIMAIAVQ